MWQVLINIEYHQYILVSYLFAPSSHCLFFHPSHFRSPGEPSKVEVFRSAAWWGRWGVWWGTAFHWYVGMSIFMSCVCLFLFFLLLASVSCVHLRSCLLLSYVVIFVHDMASSQKCVCVDPACMAYGIPFGWYFQMFLVLWALENPHGPIVFIPQKGAQEAGWNKQLFSPKDSTWAGGIVDHCDFQGDSDIKK